MKRRVRPVADLGHETMFYRIVVNVIDVPGQIFLVADRVLPETSLPQSLFSALVALETETVSDDLAREQAFDALPTSGKIRIVLRKRHDNMQMIG